MKTRIGILALLMLSLVLLAATISPGEPFEPDDGGWLPVVEGAIDFQKFLVDGPNQVFVARMHRVNSDAFIDSSIAQGRLSSGIETVSGMAARYDQAINYWDPDGLQPTWGGRNQVVVAINGFYYDAATGVPQNGQIQSSWLAKRYAENGFAEGFVWKSNRQAFMGECIFQDPDQQLFIHTPSATEIEITDINRDRNGNELILFTPQYGPSTLTPDKKNSVEVLVEVDGPTRLLQGGEGVTGTVRDIRLGQGSTMIPFDHVVLSAVGVKKDAILGTGIQIGDPVEINQRVIYNTNPADCVSPPTIGMGLAYAGIGGYPVILRDGVISTPDPNGNVQNPRTAIGFNDDYVYFVVVDGRNPGVSEGMTHLQLATFIRDVLGGDWAINQDGGGSSTMVINGQVVNNTYCNHVDCRLSTGNPAEVTAVPDQPQIAVGSENGNSIYMPFIRLPIQRAVANGMMMVIFEPMNVSTTFTPGQTVTTIGESTVRLGPGTNYLSLGVVGANSIGVVQDPANGLDGVLAKGYFWWKVSFGSTTGWVPEGDITALAQPRPASGRPTPVRNPKLQPQE
jgi:Phosphodiester glycosidase